MKKKIKGAFCVCAIALVGLFAVILQSVFAASLFFASIYFICLAFQEGTQTWFSSLFSIAAVMLFFAGDWLYDYRLPAPAWWRQFVESNRR